MALKARKDGIYVVHYSMRLEQSPLIAYDYLLRYFPVSIHVAFRIHFIT